MMTFEEIGIRSELVKAVTELGYEHPMPVQEQVIPVILQSEQDVVALAQTGTGKTAAFGLPLLSRIDETNRMPQVLALCPTRELCLQIASDLTNYSKYINGLRIVAVYGGTSIDAQIRDLKQGAQVIVATPGRMNDLIRRNKVNLSQIHSVVLDESDEMLNMGFKEELNAILEEVPTERRTMLFSATMPREVAAIASSYMKNAKEITVGTKNAGSETISHQYCVVHAADRYFALKRVVDFYPEIYGIIFCRTRSETKEVAEKLMKDGYSADALHGDLSQAQRDYVMQRFRLKSIQMLVATDVAARGLDVDDLTHVINYNLPDEIEIYTHRSGRTGRAGKSGISVSIIHSKERGKIPLLEKILKRKFEYKPVPGGKEICQKQLFNLVDKMEKVEVNETEIEEFLSVVYTKLEAFSREDLIKRFVSAEFNRFLDYYKNAPDLNVPEGRERRDRDRDRTSSGKDFALFRINLGSMDGLNARDLISLINEFTRNRSIVIGKASINKKFSLFEADGKYTDTMLNAFRSGNFEGRRISVELAREGDTIERKERSYRGERGGERGGDRGFGRPQRREYKRNK
ncbi:MAG: DEAD/DEAH box helicase [Bacteroidota bacterium]|nr:DEAD/DEAH box helicase [Bacteroidota bacterium]